MRPYRVAIIGGGPSGSALATLLAGGGVSVTLFHSGRRPELIVGESLVPAVVPILRRLGVESDVAAIGVRKPGVSFFWSDADRVSFVFDRFAQRLPPYAYNVPRHAFDEVLLSRAMAAGAVRVDARARLERRAQRAEEGERGAPPVAGGGVLPAGQSSGASRPQRRHEAEVVLSEETLAAAPSLGGRQPDLIVDASGRSRLIARLLAVPARVGPRDDVAHFAHYQGFEWDEPPGQVVINRMAAGWSWRIPLPDRLSVGIVVGREHAARLGNDPEERLERAIAGDAVLSAAGKQARRVSGVATYSNYQLISRRGHGPGWAMVGDAIGFVDPMLSPGVFLALRSAELVAEAIIRHATHPSRGDDARQPPHAGDAELARALDSYAAHMREQLAAWMDLVAYFYDGRLFALYRSGTDLVRTRENLFTRVMQNHVERHVAWMASGAATTSRYSRGLLRWLARYGLRGFSPAETEIR
jgi:flavin-dependent dehydrogenase